jgi:ferredoxin
LVGLSIFSLVYFGFYRKGCICAIGSIQNVALALFGSGYAIPAVALAFFTLPIAFSLLGGRTFCAGVCPHGALQDLVLIKPLKVPSPIEHALGTLPYIYLGAGVLFAATGSVFIICQYDPFVPIFRMNGRSLMVGAGVGLLLLGMFVGRPYCRFLCPLGALLKLGAVVAKFRVRVTPDYCTQCRLCEASCPFGAMRLPEAPAVSSLNADRRRLAFTVALLPVLIAGGVWLGGLFANSASRMHPAVQLANRFIKAKETIPKAAVLTPQELAIERARRAPRETLLEAAKIRAKFQFGTRLFGGWVGLVIGAKLTSLALRRKRSDYEPDRGDCFACARCFEYCPNELVRRGTPLPAAAATALQSTSKSLPPVGVAGPPAQLVKEPVR